MVMSCSPITSLPSLGAEEGIKEMFLTQVKMLIFPRNWQSVYPSFISDVRPPFLTYTFILLLVYPYSVTSMGPLAAMLIFAKGPCCYY